MNDDIQYGVPAALESPGLTPQQEFELLKQRVPKIMKRRVLSSVVMIVIWLIVGSFLYFKADSPDTLVVMIPVLIGLTLLGIASFIVELVNVRRPHDWYQAINFFVWNMLSQISTMSARARAQSSKWNAIGAIVRFNPKDAVKYTFDHIDARLDADRSVADYRDSQVIDKYLELRRSLEFTMPPSTR